jgi:phospholipase D1/2
LDLCYGRWDTNQHSIADAHPGNMDRIVFPGQDFNNARMLGKKRSSDARLKHEVLV